MAPVEALFEFSYGADLRVRGAMLGSALLALMVGVSNGSDKLMEYFLRSYTVAHDLTKAAQKKGVKHLALSHLIPGDDSDYNIKDWQKAVAYQSDGALSIGRDRLRIALQKDKNE